jgi:hypothetical protein
LASSGGSSSVSVVMALSIVPCFPDCLNRCLNRRPDCCQDKARGLPGRSPSNGPGDISHDVIDNQDAPADLPGLPRTERRKPARTDRDRLQRDVVASAIVARSKQ